MVSAAQFVLAAHFARASEPTDAPDDPGPTIGPWVAGSNTVLSIAGGRARATAVGSNNPRISRQVTGLTPGKRYNLQTENYIGTIPTTMYFRVSSTDANLGSWDLGQWVSGSGPVEIDFVAPSNGYCYMGIVGVADGSDQHCETNESFTLKLL